MMRSPSILRDIARADLRPLFQRWRQRVLVRWAFGAFALLGLLWLVLCLLFC